MKSKVTIIIAVLMTMLLSSCGTARKAERNQKNEVEVQQDTLPPTHPPVVVPHTWRDAQ